MQTVTDLQDAREAITDLASTYTDNGVWIVADAVFGTESPLGPVEAYIRFRSFMAATMSEADRQVYRYCSLLIFDVVEAEDGQKAAYNLHRKALRANHGV